MVHKSTYYNVNDIPQEFIGEQLTRIAKNWGCTPARSLSDICDAIAKEWAKSVNDPSPWLARIEATAWEPVSGSVYSIYRNTIVEMWLINKGFKSLKHNSEFYWFPKRVTYKSVEHWLNDDFRGTMENPF